jgi:DNA-binding beta-propeller fold protein YncE
LLTPMPIAMIATGKGPAWIALDPAGQYAYVVNITDNTVSQYATVADGSLVPLSIATVQTGTKPFVIALVR